jgi:hypothetical protein
MALAMKAGDAVSFRLLVTDEESWIDQPVTLKRACRQIYSRHPQLPKGTNSSKHLLLDYAPTNELGQPMA